MIRRSPTAELTVADIARIRELLWDAFAEDEDGGFDEDDWAHALGGMHFIGEDEAGRIIAHAAVVERPIEIAAVPVMTGYVEAVAVDPDVQRLGYGTAVMRAVNEYVAAAGFELGMLGTGSHGFYERLGWRRWRGLSSVRTADGVRPTPDEDGYLMYLRTPATPAHVEETSPISCDWRPGDVW